MCGAYKRDEIEAAAAAKLASVYKDDLDQTLGTELVQFSVFVNHCLEEENDKTRQADIIFSTNCWRTRRLLIHFQMWR